MALAVLPMLSIGGMQLFKTESYETPDKVVPKAASFAAGISIVYITLTVIWALMLWGAGMPMFDSIAPKLFSHFFPYDVMSMIRTDKGMSYFMKNCIINF